jgi:hypothetical protein
MRGRLPKYREFLHTLSDVLDLSGARFAKAIGKQSTNVSQYMSGSKEVGPKTLASAVRHIGEWQVSVVQEVKPIPKPLTSLPESPGIYALYDSSANLVYLGQASNLRTEIAQTLNRKANFPVRRGPTMAKKARPKYKDLVTYLSAYEVPSKRLRHNLEALLLRILPNQLHNIRLGNFQ